MSYDALREAAERPWAWVLDYPGYFDPATGGEPPYTDFSDVEKPGYKPLILANPSTILSLIERCEELEGALGGVVDAATHQINFELSAQVGDRLNAAIHKADAALSKADATS